MTRDLFLVALSLFTWGLGEGMFIFFQPFYLQQLGADPRTIGGILGVVGISMTVAHLPNQRQLSLETIGNLGSVSSLGTALIFLAMGTFNPLLGLILGQIFVGLYATFIWRGDSTIWYIFGFFFVGGFLLSRSMAAAFTQSFVHIHSSGLAFGIVEAMNGMAMFLAPLAAGILFEKLPELVYMTSLALIAGSILLNIWLLPGINKKNIAAKLASDLE
jgi:hypothetical protein